MCKDQQLETDTEKKDTLVLPDNSILFQLDGGGVVTNLSGFTVMSRDGVDMMRHMARVLFEENEVGQKQKELVAQAYYALLPHYLLSKMAKGIKYSPIRFLVY